VRRRANTDLALYVQLCCSHQVFNRDFQSPCFVEYSYADSFLSTDSTSNLGVGNVHKSAGYAAL
jgi:hypothetical protein